MQVKLKNVRITFPHLFVAAVVQDGDKPSFSSNFLIEKDDPQVKAINAAIDAAAKEKWGVKADAMVAQLRKQDRVCLHDGDMKATMDGYAGRLYISARNSIKPTVVDADKTPLTQQDGKPYSGCYVNVVLDIYAQDNKFGKRVNASLGGVQFFRDGEAFAGGRAASEDDFDDVTSGADADDLV